ncbi:MAG TPA: helix-turn-helix domain-containing protein [Bordetella sp.]
MTSLVKREIRAGASISEAAAKVGYASESAFRNAFKRVTDMAPGQYRQTTERVTAEPRGSPNAETHDF